MNIIMAKEEQDVKPIFEEEGVTYIYVKYKNLYSTLPPSPPNLSLSKLGALIIVVWRSLQ